MFHTKLKLTQTLNSIFTKYIGIRLFESDSFTN